MYVLARVHVLCRFNFFYLSHVTAGVYARDHMEPSIEMKRVGTQLRLNLAGDANLKNAHECDRVTPKSNSGNVCKALISQKPVQMQPVTVFVRGRCKQ